MNAYELADDLEKLYWLEGDGSVCPFQAQATMLRQQADRIAELEKELACVRRIMFGEGEE